MSYVLSALLGYCIGSIPTGLIIARLLGADLYRSGSGHTGATNVARATRRLWPAIITALLDVTWGLAAVWLAQRWPSGSGPWSAAVAGIAAIAGHNWPIYLRFRGGVGISTFSGAMLGLIPLTRALGAAVALVALWFALHALLKHGARTTTLLAFLVAPLLWALGASAEALLLASVGALAVIAQSARDWNRVYARKGAR